MIVAIVTDKKSGRKYIGGVWAGEEQRIQYLLDHKEPLRKLSVSYHSLSNVKKFPFYAREDENGNFFFFPTCWHALATMCPAEPGTIFRLDKPYVPEKPWKDEMGRLNHHHICGAEE